MEETQEHVVAKDSSDKKESSKKIRKRTKALLKNVKYQMEFYFSDANLQKDRFIKQEIDKSSDGYVDINLFLKFNKIKTMTEDLSIISKAVSKSDKLELNDDGSRIKRKTLFIPRDLTDIDARTVYVECLPRTVNHEWIHKVFGECGIINYISLPKFKSTRDPKGFGFVEFDSQESAAKACELLNNPPVELGSRAGRFPKSNKQLEQLQKKGVGEAMVTDCGVTETKTDVGSAKQRKRRHRNISESSVDGSDVSGAKKSKRSFIEDQTLADGVEDKRKSVDAVPKSDEEGIITKQKKKKKKKKNRRSQEVIKTDEEFVVTDSSHGDKPGCYDNQKSTSIISESDSEVNVIQSAKQSEIDSETKTKTETSSVETDKNRKRKHRSLEEVKVESDINNISPPKRKRKLEGSTDASSESDQVTDIKSKKKSRNSVEFSEPVVQNIKHTLSKQEAIVDEKKKKRHRKKKKDIKEAETLHLRVLSKTEWLNLRKDYLAIQKSNMSELKKKLLCQQKENKPDAEMNDGKGHNKSKLIEFLPDVIVKVESRTPLDKKNMREMFNSNVDIAYIDVTDGNMSGFIRCKDAKSATSVVNSNLEYHRFQLLSGEDEKEYWKKLESDRENKLNNKKKPKKRGVHKLVDKAQKVNAQRLDKNHVFFED